MVELPRGDRTGAWVVQVMQSVEGMILAAAIRLDLTAFIEQREPKTLREDHHLYSPVAVTHSGSTDVLIHLAERSIEQAT